MKLQASNFISNTIRESVVESLATEYLSLLAILYGDQIESGMKRISYFGSMTMLDVENELRIRTMMMKGQRMRRKRQLLEEHQEAENEMLEQLRRSHQP